MHFDEAIQYSGKRNQPDTSHHLTASRPPLGLKVVGRREYKNVIRNSCRDNFIEQIREKTNLKGDNFMILEVAILRVIPGQSAKFEDSFKQASKIISSIKGYIEHELQKCMEEEDKYILLVRWENLEDHTIGFRGSKEYQEWKALLHHYYDPFPVVEHYKKIELE